MHRLTFFFVNYVPFLNCEVELNVCIIENFMSLSYVLRHRDSIIKLYLFSYNAHDISIKDVYKPSNIFLSAGLYSTRRSCPPVLRNFYRYIHSSKSNNWICVEEIDERNIRHDASRALQLPIDLKISNTFARLNTRSRRKFARLVTRLCGYREVADNLLLQ